MFPKNDIVTFSYTFAWYKWEDWERLLDWAAWRGINLQLAWVGYEKIFLESFREIGMTDDEILPFFSGPAFQAWNRFGNIKGSWGGLGGLPMAWIDAQFDLQKKIVARMVELGITPILPAFPGFVPDAIHRARPNANVTKASNWAGVEEYSEDLWLDPFDDTYVELQRHFVEKQIEVFGNITNIYTLDQFNEMSPGSDDPLYLSQVSKQTYQALSAANPAAIWLMQAWLFLSNPAYWTNERIDAYLGGVEAKTSWLILDLMAEQLPQWQRTNGFSGRPWIWCQLHNLGGNMNLWGQVTNITVGPVQAVEGSDSLVGFGLAPEAYEGNEVVYGLLLDQAWSASALDTKNYFHDWARLRYGGVGPIPESLFQAWELMREHVYDNQAAGLYYVGVGVYQLAPALEGLANRSGFFPAPTALGYDPKTLQRVWQLMVKAGGDEPTLWKIPAFELDFVDVTRQVMSNFFIDVYTDLIHTFNSSMESWDLLTQDVRTKSSREVAIKGRKLLDLLTALDRVLSATAHFRLEEWLDAAQYWGELTGNEDLFAFNARNLVTVWIWEGPYLNDYSARAWSGITGTYYHGRWSIFVDGLNNATRTGVFNETVVTQKTRAFEKEWQYEGFSVRDFEAKARNTRDIIEIVQEQWLEVF